MSHFVAYILQFQEIIVYKIPPGGEGVYSQPKVYQLLLELSLDLFNTLHICYRHIEDVHEEV